MSRIRTTLDSVTKAVGSTDLISKFSRFKPSIATVDGAHAEKALAKAESLTSNSTAAASPPETAMKEKEAEEEGERNTAAEEEGQQVAEKPFVVTKKATSSLASAASASAMSSTSTVAKQTMQLFHPTALSTNMDETYKTLAEHINSYFGTSTQVEEGENKKAQQQQHRGGDDPVSEPIPSTVPQTTLDHIPVLSPVAEAKSTEAPDYLSIRKAQSSSSVQAFVGSYIAPLVPKFRSDSKSIVAEKDSKSSAVDAEEQAVDKAGEKTESEEEKAKRQLLTQREKIIARVSVDNRNQSSGERPAEGHRCQATHQSSGRAQLSPPGVPRDARCSRQGECAALSAAFAAGQRPSSSGCWGLLALQTLQKLQNLTGKRIHQLFDYICGVSTGAILAFMLGIFQIPLEECEEMYRKLGADVFKQNVIVGTVKMGWSHAFYDSEIWENILKERMGDGHMIETARDPNCPKVSAVSAIVNRGLPLKAYVFRNYRLMPGMRSHYLGDCKHKMWQAIRASSAAPGYFQEFVLGKDLHQDGGLLINNPTALAIHECKCLWPNTPLQCVLSLGTGRYETAGKNSTTYTSLKAKLTNVISSATDTEEVHTMLDALLPPDTYFRFNPYMSEDIPLNESRVEKLNFLKSEGERYLERNDAKLRKAASVLGQEKSTIQRLAEWGKLKADMYEGLPFTSKL
ncbi:Calcium-independent phospholipase A2-gamma [Larimichthys crocea]|uniref:Calcium-independent phospholipase A2-gamma n=1 Tax=Larimichthys crocea TaxID=215358 RepID=A0A6G0HR25_LARCR|nr:Calcium-independent phospholipase A2-gamma [Larimichthys crocea]